MDPDVLKNLPKYGSLEPDIDFLFLSLWKNYWGRTFDVQKRLQLDNPRAC